MLDTAQLDAEIAYISERINKGDTWLGTHAKDHPRYATNRKTYTELVGQLLAKTAEREAMRGQWRSCLMVLPPGITYGQGNHTTVKVLRDGEPQADDELTLDELGQLLSTATWVKGVLQQQCEPSEPQSSFQL